MKILLVSDSHGEEKLIEQLILYENPNLIIHCGDHQLDINWLNQHNIIYVKGNNDLYGKDEICIEILNKKICIVHGHEQYHKFNWHDNLINHFNNLKPDIICYGHSHKEIITYKNNICILNPGSITYPRNKYLNKSYIILTYDNKNKNFIPEIKYLYND